MSNDTDGDEVQAPGWDAIDAALKPIYGGQEPKHFGTVLPMSLGGSDPLQGISAYRNSEDRTHWHYITYGFTDLYDKESQDPEWSGFGFELTFRLAADLSTAAEDDPPNWPLNFLQNIAKYVFKTGKTFDVGNLLNLNGPISLGKPTEIKAVAFALDPQLGTIDTPNSKIAFLQVVGLRLDEYGLAKKWNSMGILDELTADSSLLVTDLDRDSILSDSARAERIRTAAEAGEAS